MGHCLIGHLNLSNVIVQYFRIAVIIFHGSIVLKKKKINVFVKSLENLTEFKYWRKRYLEKLNFPLVNLFFLLSRLNTSLGYPFWRLGKLGDQFVPIAVEVDG